MNQNLAFLDKLTVKNRILLLICFVSFFILVVSSMTSAYFINKNLYVEKSEQVNNAIEISTNLVQEYKDRVKSGELTTAAAMSEVKRQLSQVQFNGNYVWVNDYEGVVLVHPTQKMVNTNQIEMSDPNGVKIFKKSISIAKSQERNF